MNVRCLLPLGLALIVLAPGCDSPKKKTVAKAGAAPPIETRATINKTTQEVFKLDEELKKGAVLAATGVTSTDYLGATSDAYKTSVAKIGGFAVTQAMQMYEVQNDKPIKDYDEFMAQIIKKGQPDGIQLPMLPYYQEYAYDEANKKLVTIEYPERKEKLKKQRDEELGR